MVSVGPQFGDPTSEMKDQGTIPTVSVGKTDFLLLDCNAIMQNKCLWFNQPLLELSDVFLKSLEMHHLWML